MSFGILHWLRPASLPLANKRWLCALDRSGLRVFLSHMCPYAVGWTRFRTLRTRGTGRGTRAARCADARHATRGALPERGGRTSFSVYAPVSAQPEWPEARGRDGFTVVLYLPGPAGLRPYRRRPEHARRRVRGTAAWPRGRRGRRGRRGPRASRHRRPSAAAGPRTVVPGYSVAV